ncbi:glycosyltransferase [Lactococcus phage AM5]|uniref:Glycosyltransferase n=1 Tax=Lactococcus phage AM5 TaxID=1965473 RepID=A0A1W6JKV0_9CAUD|nr:glycosyltransferase [Lactococcus phage AM5]
MNELETAQELAETAVRQVNVFALQGDKVDFLINQLNKIASLPQLTIPKNIADKLDDIFITFIRERHSSSVWNLLWRAEEIDWEIGEQLSALLPDENQVNIAIAYFAGKALGVDLVKVEEG